MRIKNLDIGLERISRWRVDDEFHLPHEGRTASAFLPQNRPLDEILTRPSLDERLPDLLVPTDLDPDLLEPTALTDTRKSLVAVFSERAQSATSEQARAYAAAAHVLASDDALDAEVRAALAMLLRG